MVRILRLALAILTAHGTLLGTLLGAQQRPDRSYRPSIPEPTHAEGAGPVVCLDEGHHNFHTLAERFWAFGELLRRDGYVVEPRRAPFSGTTLARCAVLVISNAQPSAEPWSAYPYPTPGAFTQSEISATHAWVQGGGRLLLIADHMPLAGAAAGLAAAFGVAFNDGFAMEGFDTPEELNAALGAPTIFRAADRSLRAHAIVRGRDTTDVITSVRTFTGQAFQAPAHAEPLLVLPERFISLMPAQPWQFSADTPRIAVGGWLQGAVMRVGAGRAVFFGEAAMFSAQLAGENARPMGMNAPGAEQNFRFVLNLMRWLSEAR
jgi:hypothetical protein